MLGPEINNLNILNNFKDMQCFKSLLVNSVETGRSKTTLLPHFCMDFTVLANSPDLNSVLCS